MKHASNIISFLQRVLTLSEQYPWIVIICPTASTVLRRMHIGLSVLWPRYAGRTTKVKQGRISIIDPSEEYFIPEGQSFYLIYAGWSEDLVSDPKRMAFWRGKATGILTP